MAITVQRARELLGDEAVEMSDEQVKDLLRRFRGLSLACIERIHEAESVSDN